MTGRSRGDKCSVFWEFPAFSGRDGVWETDPKGGNDPFFYKRQEGAGSREEQRPAQLQRVPRIPCASSTLQASLSRPVHLAYPTDPYGHSLDAASSGKPSLVFRVRQACAPAAPGFPHRGIITCYVAVFLEGKAVPN